MAGIQSVAGVKYPSDWKIIEKTAVKQPVFVNYGADILQVSIIFCGVESFVAVFLYCFIEEF